MTTLRQVLIAAAGVLFAAAFIAAIQAFTPGLDLATLGVGAAFILGCVYVLGIASER